MKRTKDRAAARSADAAALPDTVLHDGGLQDRYAGHGGSYIFDPASGLRTPVTETIKRATAKGEKNDE